MNAIGKALIGTEWDAHADADLTRVRSRNMPVLQDALRGLPVLALKRDGVRVGTLAYEIRGKEFFVAMLAGDSGNTLADFLPVIEAHARGLGCTVMRAMTERPGLVRATQKDGWEVTAVILEKPL